jgi:hypothetical protein
MKEPPLRAPGGRGAVVTLAPRRETSAEAGIRTAGANSVYRLWTATALT